MACTGWTWAEAGRLTLPRYRALRAYWDQHPPLPVLLETWLSGPRQMSSAPAKGDPEDFQTFFQELSQAGF